MPKKSHVLHLNPSAIQRLSEARPTDTPNIDQIDHACSAATHAAALLHELAEAKAEGDTHADERLFWWGVEELTTHILKNLEQIQQGDVAVWNYISTLEAKGERKSGGAK